jgi:hypothetical protein
MTPTTTHTYKQVYSSTMFAALTMLVLLLVGANCTVAEAGSMLTSDGDPSLVVTALGGSTGMQLLNSCRPDDPDCTWSYRDGMLLSDRDPLLAVTATDVGGQLGTILKLGPNCTSDNPRCTWTFRKGMLISDAYPNLAVTATAVGGVQGTVLTLANNCTSNTPHCLWIYHSLRLLTDTSPILATTAYENARDGTVLKLDRGCSQGDGNRSYCFWTYRRGMLGSKLDSDRHRPSTAWYGPEVGQRLQAGYRQLYLDLS